MNAVAKIQAAYKIAKEARELANSYGPVASDTRGCNTDIAKAKEANDVVKQYASKFTGFLETINKAITAAEKKAKADKKDDTSAAGYIKTAEKAANDASDI